MPTSPTAPTPSRDAIIPISNLDARVPKTPKRITFRSATRTSSSHDHQSEKPPPSIRTLIQKLNFPDAPSIPAFVRSQWRNVLLLLLTGIIPLVIALRAAPLTPKYFRLDDPRYAYPRVDEFVPTWLSLVVSFLIPVVVIVPISLFLIGNFWDCNAAILGYTYALTTSTLTQSLIKLFIGGLRPNFYAICAPFPSTPSSPLEYHTSTQLSNALMSFPSGHSSAAAASFTFLALYLNAKFKIVADHPARYWQHLLLTAPLIVGALMALSKVADYWHHWHDVLAGYAIGTAFALLSYRQAYRGVFDYRLNHIPFVLLPVILDSDHPPSTATMTAVQIPEEEEGERKDAAPTPAQEVTMALRRDLTAIDFAGWRNMHSSPFFPEERT
ncbi:PAP2-domain-containing protein [Aaosphaeria arxii CBS 175.79]|uniref:PAP2-domain-containing protein n=1 Tax=Aaosphaeria arxii CBS 175.79 TaxID=1450172 RepID=A0A6A5XCI0_9PLEO|nr:PAP2-domain-containing protein [Aaosphaeria arxii CBS 175.79]KAF2010815.1 PAP2-domain-containing protein [Aaosphaeria arxii CBS 175.79]